MTLEELKTPYTPNWCPGCGNFNIWAALKNAAVKEGWDNTNTVLVAGIGCHGHIVNFIRLNSFEGLHGRDIPVATGIKLANNRLNVFVHTGDGNCMAEGGNHFMHACRRNHDITILLHDNALYALTTGQASPVTGKGVKTKSTPNGNPDEPIYPLAVAIASGATFAARAFSGDMPRLTELMIEANNHKGLSVIDIVQPCITFGKIYTHNYLMENTYQLEKEHDPTNKEKAIMKAMSFENNKIPLGIFYKSDKPSYESQVSQISENPLVDQEPNLNGLSELFKKYI
jgi:2-oxoglutarate ferredoxin oxidoreductase subunit beta